MGVTSKNFRGLVSLFLLRPAWSARHFLLHFLAASLGLRLALTVSTATVLSLWVSAGLQ